ncbi:SMC5-SMC6 complex localization factor protein 2 [Aplochiton taeniatus]
MPSFLPANKSSSARVESSVSLLKENHAGAFSLVIDAKPISLSLSTLDPKILTPQFVRLGSPVRGFKCGTPSSTVKMFKEEAVQPETRPKTSPCLHSPGLGENIYLKAEAMVSNNSHSKAPVFLSNEDRRNSPILSKKVHLDPVGDEMDLDLTVGLDLDFHLSGSSSRSSEDDEQLLSLQEILACSVQPPKTPEKGCFSTPGTPDLPRRQSKLLPIQPAKSGNYRNTLELMLKEKATNQRSKEIEMKLLLSCEEDLLRLAENEQSEEKVEEAISSEHKEFLERYSVVSCAIRDSHPGEEVFNLTNFSRLFNQNTLQLRRCNASPLETAQKTLLWSSPSQLRFHITVGLLGAAYHSSPCPPQVARLLFQMMSVHSEMMISNKILQALRSLACSAAEQIVTNKSNQFEVWVPRVSDVTLVLMNMGIPFVSIFPVETIQPPFSEGDVLEEFQFYSDRPSVKGEKKAFPYTNFENVIKYLTICTALCPLAYSNAELLLLLTMVSRVSLDTHLILQPTRGLRSLQHNLVNNFRNWDTMLPKICLALTHLTDDHHNLRWLLQLLPVETRGKQLRRHLSVTMISKLLNQKCTYKPTNTEFQLSDLRRYLPRMRPSALLKVLECSYNKRTKEEKEDNDFSIASDQQAYYLCYSLLTLANEASNYEFFPPNQKDQLLLLCAELEKHIKCDIRESEKCLYRSKVKDFVARIYTKWQVLLQRTRPLQGKLYDYWNPLPEDMSSSQEKQNTLTDDETEKREGEEEEEEEPMEDDTTEEGKKDREITSEDFSIVEVEDPFISPAAEEEFEDEQEMNLILEESEEEHEKPTMGGLKDQMPE